MFIKIEFYDYSTMKILSDHQSQCAQEPEMTDNQL